jgi:hypothetical protein
LRDSFLRENSLKPGLSDLSLENLHDASYDASMTHTKRRRLIDAMELKENVSGAANAVVPLEHAEIISGDRGKQGF